MIEHAAGRPDDDLAASLHFFDLAPNGLAAIQGDAVNATAVCELDDLVADLDRQFARGNQHQGLGSAGAALRMDSFEDRDGEGCRFTGTRLGLTHDVDARQGAWNQPGLNRSRLQILGSSERFEHGRRKREGRKVGGRLDVGSCHARGEPSNRLLTRRWEIGIYRP